MVIDSLILLHDSGWTCTNDAFFDEERDAIETNEGRKMKKTFVTKTNSYFNVVGEIKKDEEVLCVVLLDDGKKMDFKGRISGITKTKIHITMLSNLGDHNIENIKKKINNLNIKGGLQHGNINSR